MIKPGYGDNTRIMPSTRICECSLQQVIILLTGLLHARSALLKELDSGVSFRASTSYMAYHFNATAPFPGVHFRLQFSSTNCETNLLSVTSRDTDHFYRIFLQNDTITLSIKLEDGKFEISVSLSGNKTFCDGVKHSVEFNRYGQNFLSEADGKEHSRYKEPRIRKVIFSKPDKILIGGMSENKFDGCIYSARIHFYWKKGSQNVSVDLLGQYVKGDSRVRFTDVFLGGCPRRGERKNPMEECTRYKNDIYMKSGHGVIVSPRRPQASYVDQCRWFLSAPHNKRLRLSLLFYKVDVFVLCFESKVVVFDGSTPDSDVIERFCYAKPKKVVYTRGNHMLIQMNLPKNGFLDFIAEYDIVGLHEGPCPIERTLNDLYGSIASPYFPNNYGSGHDCSWVIKVPQGYHVLLSFNHTEFHIHSSTVSCDCDFLEVREGGSKGKLLGKYCGSRVPSPIYGSGYLLWLRFVSDKFSSNKGFRASYEAIEDLKDECPWDKTLTSHRGFISSPRYALDYPGNMECIWRINMANNYRVTFVFLGPLNLGPNCSDFLEIREGLDKKSPLLSLQCATAVKPANIVSSGAKLYIRFKSDSFSYMENTESGFQVTYYASQIKSDAIVCKRSFVVLTLAAWCITVL